MVSMRRKPGSHRIPLEAEAPKQEHEVVFLENFFDEGGYLDDFVVVSRLK
jgi:hypothetical protein